MYRIPFHFFGPSLCCSNRSIASNYVRTSNILYCNGSVYPHFKIFPVNTKYTMFMFCYKTSSSCIRFALSRSHSPGPMFRYKENVICGSVVVMVAMCNIMFYKIVLLSSGHQIQTNYPRVEREEKARRRRKITNERTSQQTSWRPNK